MEWWCLDWNKSSIGFYQSLGAQSMDDWTVYRLTRRELEQLAEECAELGQAALKLSRAMRRENPTRSTVEELLKMLIEEMGDVQLSIDVLDAGIDLSGTEEVKQRKFHRWCASLGEKEDD